MIDEQEVIVYSVEPARPLSSGRFDVMRTVVLDSKQPRGSQVEQYKNIEIAQAVAVFLQDALGEDNAADF